MAYSTKKLKRQALEAIEAHKFIFFEDIFAFLAISTSTFYDHFPKNSKDYEEIASALGKHRIAMKNTIRKKWYKSDHPQSQKHLYLLLGTTEERHALHGSQIENKTELSGGITLSVEPETKQAIEDIIS